MNVRVAGTVGSMLARLRPGARARAGAPRRARVLFCTLNYAPGSSGGAERQAQLQAESLVRRGYEVAVVCPRQPGFASGTVNGVAVHRVPVRWAGWGRRPMHAAGLAWFLLRNLRRYDLVHVHLAGLQTEIAVPLGRAFRRPVYVKVAAGGPRGDVLRYFSLPLLPKRFGLRHADRVQVISQQIAEDLRRVGVPDDRIVRIPNGVALSRFRPPDGTRKADARARLGLPPDRVIALYVGRLEPQKGVVDLVSVWPRITADTGSLLVLVGGGEWDTLRAGALHVDGVEVRDWSSQIEEYYAAADFFVLASHSEGMSNAVLEAMASGLPIAASRVGAAEELLDGGRVGLLFEPKDRDQLATVLRTLATDGAARERFGHAAAVAARRYSIDSVADRIEREYRALLAGDEAAAWRARQEP